MRSLIISIFLLFVLGVTPKHAFAEPLNDTFPHIDVADLFYAPLFNDTGLFGAFGGYLGGDSGNQIVDWSIGNTIPHSGSMTDDIVFSTSVGDFMNPANWFERMRITKEGNVGIGTTSPTETLTVVGTNNLNPSFPDGLQGTAKNIAVTNSTPYTVTNGKTLYILTLHPALGTNPELQINEVPYFVLSDTSTALNSPMVVPAGSKIETQVASEIRFTGIEVDTGVTIKNIAVTNSTPYTVTNGKTLYILTLHPALGTNPELQINEVPYFVLSDTSTALNSPMVVPAGSKIETRLFSEIRFTGYER